MTYKITWGRKTDRHHKTTILVSGIDDLFEAYFIITGYGRADGVTPIEVKVTNLDGVEIDMSKGYKNVPTQG